MATHAVPIPDFFVALVLPHHDEPSSEETEELRRQTVEFWNQQLETVYNRRASQTTKASHLALTCQFQHLDLRVRNAHFGSERVPREDLDERFNVYVELTGTATFSTKVSSSKKGKTSRTQSIPTGNQVFRKMIAGDSMDYLCRFVKQETSRESAKPSKSVFATAIEVCAMRLEEDPDDHVLEIRSPTFFIALATDPFDEDEARAPTATEIRNYQRATHDRIRHHLVEEHPDTLVDCQLTLAKSQTEGVKKPDDRFNLYFEHDLVATFAADPPSEDELFALVMRCANQGFSTYVTKLRELEGTPFVAVTLMSIQLTGLEEVPEGPKALEDVPEPQKDVVEEDSLEEQGSGDESEDSKEGKPKEKPPPQHIPHRALAIRRVPVFLALAISVEPPAQFPTPDELKDFEHLVLRYFYTVLKQKYPKSLVDMELKERDKQFGAGIPEPRFNLCVEYEATLRFDETEMPAPEEKVLKKLVLRVNLSTILAHVRKLHPECFEKCTEVSMRKKPKKEKPEKRKPKDSAFKAAIELLEPPSTVGETNPPNEPEPEARPVTPVEEVHSVADTPKKKKKVKKVKKEKKKPKSPPPSSPSLIAQDLASKNLPPLDRPESDATKTSGRRVKTAEVYTALKLNYTTEDPPDEDYEKLRKNTQDFFTKRLETAFGSIFSEVRLKIHHKAFGTERPDKSFNVYVEWDIDAFYEDGAKELKSVSADRREHTIQDGDTEDNVPTPDKLTKVLVRDTNVMDYLLQAVQPIKKTAFANVTMGFMAAKTSNKTHC